MIKHIAANITALATVLGFCWVLLQPHIDQYIEERFYAALTSDRTTTHLQSLDRAEGNRVLYWVSGRMLRVFLNIPEDSRTSFHNGEIVILKEEMDALRDGPILNDFKNGQNRPTN